MSTISMIRLTHFWSEYLCFCDSSSSPCSARKDTNRRYKSSVVPRPSHVEGLVPRLVQESVVPRPSHVEGLVPRLVQQ